MISSGLIIYALSNFWQMPPWNEKGEKSINEVKMHKNDFFSFKNMTKPISTDNSPDNTTIAAMKL